MQARHLRAIEHNAQALQLEQGRGRLFFRRSRHIVLATLPGGAAHYDRGK